MVTAFSDKADTPNKLVLFFLVVAIVVYFLWAGVGLLMPDFYFDRPLERLFFAFVGVMLAVYLLSNRALLTKRRSLLLSLYVLILHFHFLSLFFRAGGDEIYALGVLVFLIGASLLFFELRLYLYFFIIVIASYIPAIFILELPSYRIVMLIAGILTIGIATSLLLFMRIRMSEQYFAQNLAIADLERQLVEKKLVQQEEETERYKADAYYDSLTGLPNRKSFHDYLQRTYELACRKKSSFAILFADLDCFKKVNDTYGHDAGDAVLYQFADRFKTALRSSDYPARYAGDEFVAILPEIDTVADAKPICERILKIAAEPYSLAPEIACITSVSIGIAIYPGREISRSSSSLNVPQDTLMCADSAMYEAKRCGKNRWVFYSESLKK